jgi:hypothetical protein
VSAGSVHLDAHVPTDVVGFADAAAVPAPVDTPRAKLAEASRKAPRADLVSRRKGVRALLEVCAPAGVARKCPAEVTTKASDLRTRERMEDATAEVRIPTCRRAPRGPEGKMSQEGRFEGVRYMASAPSRGDWCSSSNEKGKRATARRPGT